MNHTNSHQQTEGSNHPNHPAEGREIRYCPYCGTPVARKFIFGAQRPTCPNCGWTYFADPKVAAGVLVEEDGRVLLTRRVMEPLQGYWTLPAGFVDAYEDPARAAERECLEETGLEVKVTSLLDVIAGREHPAGADIVIIYRASISGGKLHPGDDADRVCFFPKDHLPPLAFHSTQKVLGATSG